MYILKIYYLSICTPDTFWRYLNQFCVCPREMRMPSINTSSLSINQVQQQVKAKEGYQRYLCSDKEPANNIVVFTTLHLSVTRASLWNPQAMYTCSGQKGKCNSLNCPSVSPGRSERSPGGLEHYFTCCRAEHCANSCSTMEQSGWPSWRVHKHALLGQFPMQNA